MKKLILLLGLVCVGIAQGAITPKLCRRIIQKNSVQSEVPTQQKSLEPTRDVLQKLSRLWKLSVELHMLRHRHRIKVIWEPNGTWRTKTLLEHHCEVNALNAMSAKVKKIQKRLSDLLSNTVNGRVCDRNGNSMLCLLAGCDYHGILKKYNVFFENCCDKALASGCDPDYQVPDTGVTALHIAACCESSMMVGLLLDCGANPCIADKRGRFPVDMTRDALTYNTLCEAMGGVTQAQEISCATKNSAVPMNQAPAVTQEPDLSYWETLNLMEGPSALLSDDAISHQSLL